MYIIVGLGNPGKEYENTRHNMGFLAIDRIAEKMGVRVTEKKFKALVGSGMLGGQKTILVKPQTYMNLSGESVRQVLDFYKVDETQELIVLSDDISLDVGQLRIRKKGSAGGHNGLKNIILHLGHDNFQRIKIGVGDKDPRGNLVNHVLGHLDKEGQEAMDETLAIIADAVESMIVDGPDVAMNKFNTKKK